MAQTFTEVSGSLGVSSSGATYGASWADINGDDRPDLWLGNHGAAPQLLLNGVGGFSAAGGVSGLTNEMFGASFADIDNDGDQDLFVAVGAQDGTGSDPNLLLINDGSGGFTDQAASMGLDYPMGRGRHGTWFDWNDDGRLDIAVINNNRRAAAPHFESAIFTYDAQSGAFTLEDDTFTSKQFTFYAQISASNGAVADPALFVQHSQTKYPDGVLSFGANGLSDVRGDFGFPNINRISDSAIADVNNDGLQDIIAVTPNDGGYLLLQNATGLINATGTSGIAGIDDGQFVVAADFDNDKDIDLYVARSDQGNGTNVVNEFYANQGDGSFVLEASARGAQGTTSGFVSGLAAADFNNDGFIDLIATNSEDIKAMASGPVELFENQGNGNNFITITLEGVASNRDGIGAVVALTSGGTTQYRERNGGIHSRSQDDGRLHFGLGTDSLIDSIVVTWPDGTSQTFTSVAVNAFITINQTTGIGGGPMNDDPVAMFTATPIAGTTGFSFDASGSSDSDGTIVSYDWDFGDGTTGSGVGVSHVFPGQGMYNVALTVTDDQGGTSVFSSSVNAQLDVGVVAVGGGDAEAGNILDELGNGGQDLSTAWNSGSVLADAFFTVDLGSVMPIIGIDIAPRGDLAYSLDISAGTALAGEVADGPVVGSCAIPGGGNRAPSALVECPVPETMARYLTIRSTNEADFEVYGFDYRLPPEMMAPAPLPAFIATPMSASQDVALDATLSTDPEDSALTFLWNLGDGNSSTNAVLTHTYASTGTYRVELTATNAAGESTTIGADVEVGAGGVIGALPLGILNVGWSFNSSDNAIDTLASGEQRLQSHWKNSNGLVESAWITYDLGETSAVEEVRLALRNNHDFTLEIQIGDTPVDNQIVDGPIINCNVPVQGSGTAPSGFFACAAMGTGRYVTVRETIRARLQIFGTEIDGIVAGNNVAPTAAFSSSQTLNTLDVTFDASMSSDTDGTVDAFAWDFGGGSTATGETVTHTFTSEGDFTVALAVTDNGGAVNAISRVVSVDPLPTPPSFVTDPQSLTVEIGEAATFMATVDGTAPITLQWQMNGSDIAGATGASYTFANPQLADDGAQISVVATNAAASVSSAAATLTVLPPNQLPVADIVATPTTGFNPLIVDFDASNSADADGTITAYAWDFGDGNSGNGALASNEYLMPGTYTATLTVTDDDSATGTATVSIVVDQSAEVIIVQQPQSVDALVGDNVTFEVAVTGTPVVEYQWRKNGAPVAGATATSLNIGAATLAQSGDVYDVVVTNPINTVTSQPATLTVNELPVASFTQAPSAGVVPFTVSFDASASTDNGSIVSYDWLFGDGSTGSGVQTTHEYVNAGEFVVTLTVTDDLGGTSMTTRTVSANAAPTAAFSVDTAVGLTPRTVLFDGGASADSNGSIVDYAWTFGDGGSAGGAAASTSYLYVTPGEYTATLIVTDDQGATDTTSATVIANTAPVAALTVNPGLGLAPLAVNMDASGSSDAFGNIVDYTFDFGDGNGTSGASATASHSYANPGDYTV
ncbi:MAG: PKD domain-containing protein, partial [Pseudomonadota bacterium]